MMLDLFYILIGGLAAIFILTIIICLIFRRRLIWERPLDPRRDQLSIVQNNSYYKRRLLNGEEYRLFQFLEDWMKEQKPPRNLCSLKILNKESSIFRSHAGLSNGFLRPIRTHANALNYVQVVVTARLRNIVGNILRFRFADTRKFYNCLCC